MIFLNRDAIDTLYEAAYRHHLVESYQRAELLQWRRIRVYLIAEGDREVIDNKGNQYGLPSLARMLNPRADTLPLAGSARHPRTPAPEGG